MGKQRALRRSGKLAPDRLAVLEGIEFPWTQAEETWKFYITQLRAFRRQSPEGPVPFKGTQRLLAEFIHRYRREYRAGVLPEAKAQVLQGLGIDMHVRVHKIYTRPRLHAEESWTAHYEAVRAYVGRGKRLERMPKGQAEHGLPIHSWLQRQRHLNRIGKLPEVRFKKLEDLGMRWNQSEEWERRFAELLHFRAQHQHQRLGAGVESQALPRWVSTQRIRKRSGALDLVRERRLADAGFAWTEADECWEFYLPQLRDFRAVNGPTAAWPSQGPKAKLRAYVRQLRREHLAGLLQSDKLRKLQALGVEWAFESPADEGMLARLRVLTKRYGKENLRQVVLDDAVLARWLKEKEVLRRRNALPEALDVKLRKLQVLKEREAVVQAPVPRRRTTQGSL